MTHMMGLSDTEHLPLSRDIQYMELSPFKKHASYEFRCDKLRVGEHSMLDDELDDPRGDIGAA